MNNLALTRQFLEYLPRDYRQVMEAWRSSCPQLSIYEDALENGLITYDSKSRSIVLTQLGKDFLSC